MSLWDRATKTNSVITQEDLRSRFRTHVGYIANLDPDNKNRSILDIESPASAMPFRSQIGWDESNKVAIALINEMKRNGEILEPKIKRLYEEPSLREWAMKQTGAMSRVNVKVSEVDPFRRLQKMLGKLITIRYQNGEPVRIWRDSATVGELRLALELFYAKGAQASIRSETLVKAFKTVIEEIVRMDEKMMFGRAVAMHCKEIMEGRYNPY